MKLMRIALLAGGMLLALPLHAEIVDIDNAELERLVAAGVPLVDVRTAAEWEESGIVPASRLLTFFDAQGHADPAAWLERVRRVADPTKPVALICRSGNRTRAVSEFLSNTAGYQKVYNVRAGIKGWIGEGRPVVPARTALAGCAPDSLC